MKQMTMHTMSYPLPIVRPESTVQRATLTGDLWELWSPKTDHHGYVVPVFMGTEDEMVSTLKEGGKVEKVYYENSQRYYYKITEAF